MKDNKKPNNKMTLTLTIAKETRMNFRLQSSKRKYQERAKMEMEKSSKMTKIKKI